MLTNSFNATGRRDRYVISPDMSKYGKEGADNLYKIVMDINMPEGTLYWQEVYMAWLGMMPDSILKKLPAIPRAEIREPWVIGRSFLDSTTFLSALESNLLYDTAKLIRAVPTWRFTRRGYPFWNYVSKQLTEYSKHSIINNRVARPLWWHLSAVNDAYLRDIQEVYF